jgi:proteic killer suppression protein
MWDGDSTRINAAMRDRVSNVLAVLDAASDPRDLDLPGYRLHELKGRMKGYGPSQSGKLADRFSDGERKRD